METSVTLDTLKDDAQVRIFLEQTNENLRVLGYTEHGVPHANWVAKTAGSILRSLGYPPRVVQLAEMAGYLHDIGNLVIRENHAQASALISMDILSRLGMEYSEVALVMSAVGNHEEERGEPVNPMTAATIIADKADVRRSRVHSLDYLAVDIHDRVNYAARRSRVVVDGAEKVLRLELEIETNISSVMEYFEIFLERMLISRRAARFLGCDFELVINGMKM